MEITNKNTTTNNNVENNRSKEKLPITANKLNKSGNSANKRRGRPRLYEVNPETGKAIKGRLLNDDSLTNPKANKVPKIIAPSQTNMIANQTNNIPVHLTATSNGIAIFPSPSTSSSSSYSPSVSTIFIANPNISNGNQRFILPDNIQTNGHKSEEKEKTPEEDASPVEDEEEEEEEEEVSGDDSNENSDEDSTDEDKKSLDNTRELRSLNKTLEVSSIKPINNTETSEKSCENASETNKKSSNVLTHVIDGYLIKESSKPFPINASKADKPEELVRSASSHSTPIKKQSSTHKESSLVKEIKDFKCVECGTKKPGSISKFTQKMCCSVSCFKRHSRKQQKLSKKSKSKENSKQQLEDATNNLDASSLSVNNSVNNSKNKSHRHKHHRRHHHHGSSSSSSRDKSLSSSAKKKLKKQRASRSEEQPMDTSSCPPPPSLQTLTISSINTNQSPQQQQQHQHLNSSFNNPFGSNLVFSLPNNSSSPSNAQSQSSFILNSVCANSSDQNLPGGDPTEWNCDEVYQFIKCVAGIQVAQLFRSQEVDGSALSLIRDDHLVNTMQIKLGPALKIMSKFNELNSRFKQNN